MGDPVQLASCSSRSLQLYPFFLPYFAFLLIPNPASAEILSQKAVTDITVCVFQHRMLQEGPKPAGRLQKQSFCLVYLLGPTSPVNELWVWFCGVFCLVSWVRGFFYFYFFLSSYSQSLKYRKQKCDSTGWHNSGWM